VTHRTVSKWASPHPVRRRARQQFPPDRLSLSAHRESKGTDAPFTDPEPVLRGRPLLERGTRCGSARPLPHPGTTSASGCLRRAHGAAKRLGRHPAHRAADGAGGPPRPLRQDLRTLPSGFHYGCLRRGPPRNCDASATNAANQPIQKARIVFASAQFRLFRDFALPDSEILCCGSEQKIALVAIVQPDGARTRGGGISDSLDNTFSSVTTNYRH